MAQVDKRIDKRVKTKKFLLEYKIGNNDTIYQAYVINLSSGGLCFLRTSVIEKGDILQLKFAFSKKRIVLAGEVIRVDGREVAIKYLSSETELERFVEAYNEEFHLQKTTRTIESKKDLCKDNNNDNFDSIFDLDCE